MWGNPYGNYGAVQRELASDMWIQQNVPGGLNSTSPLIFFFIPCSLSDIQVRWADNWITTLEEIPIQPLDKCTVDMDKAMVMVIVFHRFTSLEDGRSSALTALLTCDYLSLASNKKL